MEHIPSLIQDLALILLVAAVVSIIFKKLKQPVVLGYVVAGFICGPHFAYTPSVIDGKSIDIWAQIGVIILLFTLGLEFSFKKILKMGAAPVIAALSIVGSMMFLGAATGHLFGWNSINSLYLGGMLAMSSTTIIYKAFQDLGVLQQRFAGLVLSVLILEDILAIVLMVVLSTMAVSHAVGGVDLLNSMLRLGFFLILWFVVGLYLIPLLLRQFKHFFNNETLLIFSLAMCFVMAVVAVKSGFSAAFGAFVVGSILAETIEAERIEKLVAPIKDLFGAIFFVSVGMLVNPNVLVDYAWPIVVLTMVIIMGQALFGTTGFLLAGQPLKEAMKCGLSMSQIGEFAFIIASLGMSLKVTSNYLYPIVVAVSVITTFTTPYMLKLATPAYEWVSKHLPSKVMSWLERTAPGTLTVGHPGKWRKLIVAMLQQIIIFSIISISIITLSFRFLLPFTRSVLPHWWANAVCGIITLACISPFLRAILARGHRSSLFLALWRENRYNRLPLIFTLVVRSVVVCLFVFYIIRYLVPFADPLLLMLAVIMVAAIYLSHRLKKNSIRMERVFMDNLRSRELYNERMGKAQPQYAQRLLSRDIHLAQFTIPADSMWGGRLLSELNFGKRFDVHVTSIVRGSHRINAPEGKDRLYPGDQIQVIGTDAQVALFAQSLDDAVVLDTEYIDREMQLKQMVIVDDNALVGQSIKDSGIRNHYHCLIVGFEAQGESYLEKPEPNRVFKSGDVMWVVGELKDIKLLMKG